MKKFSSSILIIAVAVLISFAFNAKAFADDDVEIGSKIRVIVGDFKDKSSHGWYHGNPPGTGMADMLISALLQSKKFKVFARQQLDEILAEKNLSISDLANPGFESAKKIEIGDYLVSASITEFGYKEKKIGGSKLGLGKLGYKRLIYNSFTWEHRKLFLPTMSIKVKNPAHWGYPIVNFRSEVKILSMNT